MDFSCYKNDLVNALRTVIQSAAVNPMTPILAGVYINVTDTFMDLQTNNFTSSISIKIPVNTTVGGEVVLSGKKFFDFIRNMPDDVIKFSGEEAANTFTLSSGGATAELLTMAVTDFPKIKVPETDKSFRIRAVALKNLIRKTIFAAAKNDERPMFKACNFKTEGDRIIVAATDTHRIAICMDIVRENYEDGEFLVPVEVLRALMQYIDPNDVENYIEVKYSQRQVAFSFNNVLITARLTEGEFPDYHKFVQEKDFIINATADRIDLRTAVDFCLLIAKGIESNAVKFDIMSGTMTVSADSPEVGDARKPVELEDQTGDFREVAFNGSYLAEGLRAMDTQRILLRLKDRTDPLYITEIDNNAFWYVVTPMRI